MLLQNRRNQQWEEAEIAKADSKSIRKIKRDSSFDFDWTLEIKKDREVYKIYLLDQVDSVLGLMSLSDIEKEERIHINLIEATEENRGRGKHYDRIAGCLLAISFAFKVESPKLPRLRRANQWLLARN